MIRHMALALFVCVPLLVAGPSIATRRLQLLECFELSALRYVAREGQAALVRMPDGRVHRARQGDYLGWNDGKILRIEHTAIVLIEVHPDGEGGWYEREARLPLASEETDAAPDSPDRCRPSDGEGGWYER